MPAKSKKIYAEPELVRPWLRSGADPAEEPIHEVVALTTIKTPQGDRLIRKDELATYKAVVAEMEAADG